MTERSHAPLTLLALLAGILFLALQGGRPFVPPSSDIAIAARTVAAGDLSPASLHDALAPRAAASQRLTGPSEPPVLPALRAAAADEPVTAARCTFDRPAAWPARSHPPCARPQTGPPAA